MPRRHKFDLRLRDFRLSVPSSKQDYNRKLFSAVAGRYYAATRLLSFGWDQHWKRRLVRTLPAKKRACLLDLACGTGDITRLLADKYPDGKVVGLDQNRSMLSRARRAVSRLNVGFQSGDMNMLHFDEAAFDIVTGGYALRNAPDLGQTVGEIARILKEGGTAAFLDFSKSPWPGFQRLQLAALSLWGWLWGRLLHGNPEVYGYIAQSLARFPDRVGLEELLRDHGFTKVYSRRLLFSFIALTYCRK